MSTQQDIYAAGSENRPPMLNKDNYVPWSSRLFRYAKSKPNEKLIYNSIMNGPYVRRMIPEPGDPDREVPVAKTFHEQTNDELTNKEVKQIEVDDQAIQTILMGLPEDIYAVVDSCKGGNQFRQYVGQNVRNQNGYNAVQNIGNQNANQNRNGNVVAARAEGNSNKNNRNQTQLLIAQKEEARIQIQAKEFDLMAAAKDLDEIEEVNANYILQYTELLEPISEPHQVQQNDSNVISMISNVEQNRGTVEQHPATVKETPFKRNSAVSYLQQEKKKLKYDFKICEDELSDKQIQPEQKMALGYQNSCYLNQDQQKQQSLYNGKVLLEKHDPPVVYDSEETLQLAQESRLKMKQLNKEIKSSNYAKINQLSEVFVSQKTKLCEELYFSNTSKLPSVSKLVSKSISIPNEEFTDDTSPSVAQKFLNELHKIVKDENFPIVNQVDARIQNFKIQFLKEVAKFVRDFKYLAKEADESLAKHKALEYKIECLLRAVVSRDIMSILQNYFVVDTSNLQTELDRTKEKLKTCIIKKENEYVVLWNNWYKKHEECKYDKFLYDKAYKDMQQKIERLQAQLGDLKGKSKDTPCVSDTLDPLSQKLEDENVSLEFQVLNYAKENEHLKTTYKNLFDSIKVTRAQTKLITDSMQEKLHDTIYENATLRAQLFDKVFEQKDTTKGTSRNTKLAKPTIMGKQPSSSGTKLYSVTPLPKSRVDNVVPNKLVKTSVRIKPITVSQPHVITKKDVNSDLNGLSSTGVNNTAQTRRPQPRRNTKNDKVPSASKSSCTENKEVEVEEHNWNLLLSKNKKHMSYECNNTKLAIWNDKYEVVCAMCKQCLITANHDVCMLNYVNDMNSCGDKHNANVLKIANQKKHKPKVKKPKKVGFKERLASLKPSKPRICLRWSPTRKMFDHKGKIIASSESECLSNSFRDSGCSKHMTGNLKLLINFNLKFLGTVRFENDHIAAILGYDDLQWVNILITQVYFVEGLGHNLFSGGQFCDSDLEVALKRNTCFIRNLEGVDLLKGNRTTNLYTINLHEMSSASPISLIARTTSTKSWLWHQRLSHLNFDTINDLAKNDLVIGLPKFKYHKEHLCPSCKKGKRIKASHKPKPVPNSKQRLHLLHINLCGPIRVESINGKRYVLVIVDDYSLYTWVHFLRSKDEAPKEIKTFLKKIIVPLQALVIIVRTDNGTKFKNQVLKEYFDSVGISHQASSIRTPQQNRVMERRNRSDGFEQSSSKPRLQSMTSGQISSGLDLTYAPSTITSQKPTEHELDLLFEAMYDDYIGGQPSAAPRTAFAAPAP
ncbi:retrovirus-related pol polyprotein from transposon TNT 1-94 [Tanacetum coccineum]